MYELWRFKVQNEQLGVLFDVTATSTSQKGSHQETREMVTYDDEEIF